MKKLNVQLLLFAVVALCCSLQSCDPGYSLVIRNRSARPRNITIIYPDSLAPVSKVSQHNRNDSLTISSRHFGTRKDVLVGKKTKSWVSPYVHTFTLEESGVVLTEHGFGVAPAHQLIVIDGTDTLDTWEDTRLLKKRPRLMLGGTYTLTLN